jgi:hypothetical protein
MLRTRGVVPLSFAELSDIGGPGEQDMYSRLRYRYNGVVYYTRLQYQYWTVGTCHVLSV